MRYIFKANYVFILVLGLHFQCTKSDSNTPSSNTQDFGCKSPDVQEYVLPYPSGESYKLIQGNCGSFDHVNEVRYGFDFAMPIGSVVTAAKTGIVFFIEEDYSNGDHQQDHVNMLMVLHEDNTYGRYLHLAKDGVLVELESIISRGDTIALSGNTGYVQEPQLHFDVFSCNGCVGANTVPVGFVNAEPPVKEEGVSYLAKPF